MEGKQWLSRGRAGRKEEGAGKYIRDSPTYISNYSRWASPPGIHGVGTPVPLCATPAGSAIHTISPVTAAHSLLLPLLPSTICCLHLSNALPTALSHTERTCSPLPPVNGTRSANASPVPAPIPSAHCFHARQPLPPYTDLPRLSNKRADAVCGGRAQPYPSPFLPPYPSRSGRVGAS